MTGDFHIMPSGMRPSANELDPVRRTLLTLVRNRNDVDLQSLSLRLGRNHGYLHHYIYKGSPRELRDRDRRTLAMILGVSEGDLSADSTELPLASIPTGSEKKSDQSELTRNLRGPTISVGEPALITQAQDLPILGYAKGGEDAFFIGNGEVSGYTMRPQLLVGVSDAYAIEFWDNSMEPAFRHGHLGWVHPRKPVSPGDDVVVQLTDGQALAKNLVRRTDKFLIVRQYNPPKEIKIERSKVKAVHLIVGSLRVRT